MFPIFHSCAGFFSQVVSHAFLFFLCRLACLRLFVSAECVLSGYTLFLVVHDISVSCFNWCLAVSTF